jgi:hypothetical protein
VEATLSASRNSVVIRRRDGNTENSSASFMYMVPSRIVRESARLSMYIKSSIPVDNGTIIISMMTITNIETILLRKLVSIPLEVLN